MKVVTTSAGRRPRLPRGEGRQLRDEILAATERLLLETGSMQAVSIRAVADAVGVTPPSIYRHFDDKVALIFEVCARHFAALDEYMARACDGIEDPLEVLRALGLAYIEFGLANPEPYRIMFLTSPDGIPAEYQGNVLAESASFEALIGCVQACIDAGCFRSELTDAHELSLGFWARVHGLVSLMVCKPGMKWPDDSAFIDGYVQVCLRGVAADPPAL
jgi:AcrR family transcriptional regulator